MTEEEMADEATEDAETETNETEDTEESTLGFGGMMDFATSQVESEVTEFQGEMPNHAGTLLNQRATDVLGTLTNIQVARAHEEAEDPTDEEIRDALAEDAVDILLALGALKYEYDLDIKGAFEDRKEYVQMMEAAETQEELIEAMLEAEGVDKEEVPAGLFGAPEPGDDVTDDDYEPEDPDRHLQ